MNTSSALRHDDIFVGFKPIDDLHLEFQAILDALNAPDEGDYGTDLVALHEHMLRHTAAEEEWMLQEGFEHYARHKRAHDHLLDSISDIRRRFDAGDMEAVRRYVGDLMNWFVIHAREEDLPLAQALKGKA